MIHLTVVQCESFDSYMNWHSFLTTKETSSLVKERYCKLPTTLQKRVVFSKGGESNLDSLVEEDMGEEIKLAPIMFSFFNA